MPCRSSRAAGRPADPSVDVTALRAAGGEISPANDVRERSLAKAGWLSATLLSPGPTPCGSRGRRPPWASVGEGSITPARLPPMLSSRSCGASTHFTSGCRCGAPAASAGCWPRSSLGVGRGEIATLMTGFGISAVAPQPGSRTSHHPHPVDPCLLWNQPITHPNHVWAIDLSFLPMARGFANFAAARDYATQKALIWHVSARMGSAPSASGSWSRRSPASGSSRHSGPSAHACRDLRTAHGARHPDQDRWSGLLARHDSRRAALADKI